MKKLKKATKVKGEHHSWELKGNGLFSKNKIGGFCITMIDYKNKPRLVIIDSDFGLRKFRSIDIISPSDARRLIAWLAKYLALSDPDPISLAIASTKAHAKGIEYQQKTIARELGLE